MIRQEGGDHGWASGLWFLAVFLSRLLMLTATPWANGLDGYAYAVQILSLTQNGHPIMVDDSPLIYLLGAFNFLAQDPVLVTKVSSSLFSASLTLAVRFFVLCTGGTAIQALTAAVLVGLSPSMAFLSIDYVKNQGALVLFFGAAGWMVRAVGRGSKTVSDWGWTVFWVLMAALAHRVTTVMTLLFLSVCLLVSWVKRPGVRWRFLLALAFGGLTLATLMATGKGGLIWADWGRLLPQFSPSFSLPLASPTFRETLPVAVWLELSALSLVPWGLLVLWTQRGPGLFALGAVTLLLFLPLWEQSSLDLSFRLLTNGVPLALTLLSLCLPPLGRTWTLCLTLALLVLPFSSLVYRPQNDPNFRLWKRATQNIDLPAGSLLIAHSGLNHYYTFTHRLSEAINWEPEFEVPVDRLWRISHGVEWVEYQFLVPEAVERGLVKRLAGPYLLVREDVWEDFLNKLDPERRQGLQDWFNPWQKRPDFLLEKNRP